MDIQELYQELIIDHGKHPRNFGLLTEATATAEGFNPLCGDKVAIQLKVSGQTIEHACFTGMGCAISTASASLMTEALIGKTLKEALTLCAAFKNLLTSEQSELDLGKLSALAGVKAFPTRVKCATLAWHALEAAIQHSSTTVTTEHEY